MSTLTHPEHQGLGLYERGDTTVAGGSVKHWHRWSENGFERRRLVPGTVEGCNDAYAHGEEALSDEPLLAKIREADEAFDPAPADLGHHVHVGEVKDSDPVYPITEEPAPIVGAVKPSRDGTRTCICEHSEKRHNVSGKCRTCMCPAFRPVETDV